MEDLKLKLLIALFATHPNVDTFYLTSDDQAFIADYQADAHAQSLQDKKVKKYTRIMVEAFEAAQEKKEPATTKELVKVKAATPAAGGEKTEKQLLQEEYFKLFGKKAANVLSAEKIKALIDAEKAKTPAPEPSTEEKGTQE